MTLYLYWFYNRSDPVSLIFSSSTNKIKQVNQKGLFILIFYFLHCSFLLLVYGFKLKSLFFFLMVNPKIFCACLVLRCCVVCHVRYLIRIIIAWHDDDSPYMQIFLLSPLKGRMCWRGPRLCIFDKSRKLDHPTESIFKFMWYHTNPHNKLLLSIFEKNYECQQMIRFFAYFLNH